MPTLDRNSPIPLYHQLKQLLLASLEEKEFTPEVPLPTEAMLMEKYEVSRITVRRAMAELAQEGRIYRQPGRGTFATEPKISRGLTNHTSFSEEMKEKGLTFSSKLLAFRHEPASPHVAEKLGVDDGTRVWFIQRLRLADQQPIAVNLSYLRLPSHIGVTALELAETGSLWALLENKGIVLADVDRVIEAIPANQSYAEQLQVAIGAPLLSISGVVYDRTHLPVEYHRVVNRGDRYQYTLYLKA